MKIRPKIYIKDFGCRVNQYDGKIMADGLGWLGDMTEEEDKADIIIINTCSVTHRADRNTVKYARRIRKKYPAKELAATGCGARGGSEKLRKEKVEIVPHFMYLDSPRRKLNVYTGHSRAFLKVQQGCRGSCSYCVIRELKKPFYSKNADEVESEMRSLSEKHPEIVLCATNFRQYPYLEGVIKAASEIHGLQRWRLGSVPVGCLNEGIIRMMSGDSKFCRHFHIPVQSAGNRVLRLMNRGYVSSDLYRSVGDIKRHMADSVFSYDIMVGFPGETEEEFEETLKFLQRTEPVKVHLFRYSERPGTGAEKLNGKVPERVKSERMDRARNTADAARQLNMDRLVGKEVEVLTESNNTGFCREYIKVRIKEGAPRRKIANVKVAGRKKDILIGNMVDKNRV